MVYDTAVREAVTRAWGVGESVGMVSNIRSLPRRFDRSWDICFFSDSPEPTWVSYFGQLFESTRYKVVVEAVRTPLYPGLCFSASFHASESLLNQ